jgi:hypothetical protein
MFSDLGFHHLCVGMDRPDFDNGRRLQYVTEIERRDAGAGWRRTTAILLDGGTGKSLSDQGLRTARRGVL